MRNVISFKNMAAGAALTSKINDWAFEISENTWQNSINALNHFSAYRSSDSTGHQTLLAKLNTLWFGQAELLSLLEQLKRMQ